MKKSFVKIIITALCVCLLCTGLVACKDKEEGWKPENVTLKNWGNVISAEGFVAETDNYVYYVNGVGDSTSDNEFGKAVKGSLMAVNKTTMENPEIVVPKLFVAKDYKAGLFILGNYVYYGTPCTDKDSKGNVANSKMTFAKTKLDGSETEELFTIESLSDEYRILKGEDGKVHIVYYDSENKQLVDYNASSKAKTVIAKESETASETLQNYTFTAEEGKDGAVVVYTTEVYAEPFNQAEKDALGDSYSRTTEKYNKLYAYKVGDAKDGNFAGELIFTGADKAIAETYTVYYVTGEYVFIKVADTSSVDTTKTYGITTADLHAKATMTEVNDASIVNTSSLILALDEVYLMKDGFVRKTSLIGDTRLTDKNVAKVDTVSTLYFVEGDYIYYLNNNQNLARIKIANVNEDEANDINEHLVSSTTIASDWFEPQLVDGKVFFIDSSSIGASYVNYVDIDAEIEETTDDEGTVTARTLKGQTFIGKMTSADIAKVFEAKVNAITASLDGGKIVLDVENTEGKKISSKAIDTAKRAYERLTDAQKELVNEDSMKLYNKYLKGLELSKKMMALEGFDTASETEKASYRKAYEAVGAYMKQLEEEEYVVADIRVLVSENGNWYYQTAQKYFNASK